MANIRVLGDFYPFILTSTMRDELIQLGLSSHQADIYLALLESGPSSIGPLAKKVHLHRQIIYNTLAELERQGLVTVSPKGYRRYFRAESPENITRNIKRQVALAQEIVPQLNQHQATSKHANEITVYEGILEIQRFFRQALENQPAHSTVSIIGGGASKFFDLVDQDNFFRQYEKIRLRKQIKHAILLYENQKKDPKVDLYTNRRDLVTSKFLSDDFDQPLATTIWHDRLSMLFFGPTPLIISLKGGALVKTYQNYFKLLWKSAGN